MTLRTDTVQVDFTKLTIADVQDFKDLTGKDLETYINEIQARGMEGRTLAEIFSPEFQALLWVVLRDQATRERVWEDVDEMYVAMQRDIRKIGIDDFNDFKIVNKTPPAAARAKRPTAAQKRAEKRAEQTAG